MFDWLAQAKRAMNVAFPVGDPNELESYARWLDSQAELYVATGGRLGVRINEAGLESGGLAQRLKQAAAESQTQIQHNLGNEIRSIAEEVRTQARDLRGAQEWWKAELEKKANWIESKWNEAQQELQSRAGG